MRLWIEYCRVSSEEQAKGFSLDAQSVGNLAYSDRHKIEITRSFKEAYSAKEAGRPVFQELLQFVKKQKKPVGLLVEKTDRLYRNFKDFIAIDELIQDKDLEVHLVKEGEVLGKSASSHTKLIQGIKIVLAKNYIDNLKEEIKKGQKQKVAGGGWPHRAPYGYKNEKKQIVINHGQAYYVQEAFSLYSSGLYSLDRLIAKLQEQGFIYKSTQARISKAGLEKMLKNPFYIGDMEINGEIHKGNHAPIIDTEVWINTQQALRKDNKPFNYNKNTFKYGGLMRCGECGGAIVGEEKKGGRYTYYRCASKKKGCQQGYINEQKLNKQFDGLFASIQAPEHFKTEVFQTIQDMADPLENTFADELAEIERQTLQLAKIKRQAYQDKCLGIIDQDFFLSLSREQQEASRSLEIRREKLLQADQNYYDLATELVELPKMLTANWFRGDIDEKIKIIHLVGSNFSLKGGEISYEVKEPFSFFTKKALNKLWWKNEDALRTVLSLHAGVISRLGKLFAA